MSFKQVGLRGMLELSHLLRAVSSWPDNKNTFSGVYNLSVPERGGKGSLFYASYLNPYVIVTLCNNNSLKLYSLKANILSYTALVRKRKKRVSTLK